MLEEKNDNLQEADGKLEIDTTDSTQNDTIETPVSEPVSEISISNTEIEEEKNVETEETDHQNAL
ncbi:MAG: hypothetical protein RSH24_14550, partial [Flavobacterium sp.]